MHFYIKNKLPRNGFWKCWKEIYTSKHYSWAWTYDVRPRAPRYSEEIKERKLTCRRLERRWRCSLLTSNYQSYTDQRTVVRNTIFISKMDYYSSLIYSAESDSKTLFRTITSLVHRKTDKHFPTSSSADWSRQ